jgi:LacI family transcriptional regulator, repressor for deo operon, udp, cdd, tsx, nupC, and nupG
MATLAEIAANAGVSEATVSRVLNDKPGVSEASRQAVLTSLDVLGYERPSRLRRRSAGLVGLVVPELGNPIFPAFAQVIETVLAQKGYTPVLCTQTPGGISEDEYVESLLDHGVAGIIFVSGRHADTAADHQRYQKLIDRRLPLVFVNGYAPDLAAPFISDDDVEAMNLAVTHLVQLGHRRIGLAVGQERFVPVQRKRTGFVEVLDRLLGIPEDEALGWIAQSLFTLEGGAAAASRLLAQGATAIVCGSDLMALGAIQAARRAGLSVPGDVSVVGYDDSPLVAFVDPPLTTIRQSVQAMGVAAVDAVVEAINGTPVPPHEYVFRPELVLRGSTAVAPA